MKKNERACEHANIWMGIQSVQNLSNGKAATKDVIAINISE